VHARRLLLTSACLVACLFGLARGTATLGDRGDSLGIQPTDVIQSPLTAGVSSDLRVDLVVDLTSQPSSSLRLVGQAEGSPIALGGDQTVSRGLNNLTLDDDDQRSRARARVFRDALRRDPARQRDGGLVLGRHGRHLRHAPRFAASGWRLQR